MLMLINVKKKDLLYNLSKMLVLAGAIKLCEIGYCSRSAARKFLQFAESTWHSYSVLSLKPRKYQVAMLFMFEILECANT